MNAKSLQKNLEEVLCCTRLNEEEKIIMKTSYLQPCIEVKQLKKCLSNSDSVIRRLLSEGLLMEKKVGVHLNIYPIPLVLLIKNYCDVTKMNNQTRFNSALKSIDQWIKYPCMREVGVKLKSSEDKDTIIKWLFDLHNSDWERVYCFGDYESFISAIGVDTENEWIKERIKKMRKASVIATKDGQWARHIKTMGKKELRDCLIEPKDFSDLFIMSFPDIDTTVMGNVDGEITFIHSASIAKNYSNLVNMSISTSS